VLRETGVPTAEDLARAMPPEDARQRCPVAVFECFERIPCDPCHLACHRGAVRPFEDISDLPAVDWSKCNGCGLCVAACPGLAIFVVHEGYSATTALIKLPYELVPLPAVGQTVSALDREGVRVGEARVVRVQRPTVRTGTPVVWVEVERALAHTVRNIATSGVPRMTEREKPCAREEETMICRCEDVTLADVRQVVAEGARTLDDVKRLTRAGMGLCQGRTCRHLVLRELAQLRGTRVEDLTLPTFRPPTRPTKLGVIAGAGGAAEEGGRG